MKNISEAASALCVWVKAVEEYAQALKVVLPKKEKKEAAEKKVADMEAELIELEARFNAMMAEVQSLEDELATIMRMMEDFKKKLQTLSVKIDRGEQLVSGLSGEKIRWNATQHQLEEAFEKLVGDCLVASAFLCFVGPYPSDYRIEIGK